MTIYSWNINGYQTCDKYGGFSQIIGEQPDIVCLQEVKISNPIVMNTIYTFSYEQYYNFSVNKGHNGVYIYTKDKALSCCKEIGFQYFDQEGRFLCLEFSEYYLINVYMPHGGRDKGNLTYKIEAYDYLIKFLKSLEGKRVIIVGDFNIACSELDVERYKNNKNNTMFTEQERKVFNELLNLGYIDVYRQRNQQLRQYTWWPYAYDARNRDVGWRIDYCLATPDIAENIKTVEILKDVLGSDHCPLRIRILQ